MPERECGFRYQLPALNRAIQSGHVDTLALLLETPSFNRDYSSLTNALEYSTRIERPDAFRLILENKLRKETFFQELPTPQLPYRILKISSALQFIKILRGQCGLAYLQRAIRASYTNLIYHDIQTLNMQAVRYLIEEKMLDVNQQTSYHDTILHRVLSCTKVSNAVKFAWINMLLTFGADINIKNNKGLTPKDLLFQEYSQFREGLNQGDLTLNLTALSCLLEHKLFNVNEQSTSACPGRIAMPNYNPLIYPQNESKSWLCYNNTTMKILFLILQLMITRLKLLIPGGARRVSAENLMLRNQLITVARK